MPFDPNAWVNGGQATAPAPAPDMPKIGNQQFWEDYFTPPGTEKVQQAQAQFASRLPAVHQAVVNHLHRLAQTPPHAGDDDDTALDTAGLRAAIQKAAPDWSPEAVNNQVQNIRSQGGNLRRMSYLFGRVEANYNNLKAEGGESWGRHLFESTPFVSTGAKIGTDIGLRFPMGRIQDGTATDDDYEGVADYLARQRYQSEASGIDKTGYALQNMTPLVGELMVGGLGAGLKQGLRPFLKSTVATAIRTPSLFGRMAAEKVVPTIGQNQRGQPEVQMDPWYEAFPKAAGQAALESTVEAGIFKGAGELFAPAFLPGETEAQAAARMAMGNRGLTGVAKEFGKSQLVGQGIVRTSETAKAINPWWGPEFKKTTTADLISGDPERMKRALNQIGGEAGAFAILGIPHALGRFAKPQEARNAIFDWMGQEGVKLDDAAKTRVEAALNANWDSLVKAAQEAQPKPQAAPPAAPSPQPAPESTEGKITPPAQNGTVQPGQTPPVTAQPEETPTTGARPVTESGIEYEEKPEGGWGPKEEAPLITVVGEYGGKWRPPESQVGQSGLSGESAAKVDSALDVSDKREAVRSHGGDLADRMDKRLREVYAEQARRNKAEGEAESNARDDLWELEKSIIQEAYNQLPGKAAPSAPEPPDPELAKKYDLLDELTSTRSSARRYAAEIKALKESLKGTTDPREPVPTEAQPLDPKLEQAIDETDATDAQKHALKQLMGGRSTRNIARHDADKLGGKISHEQVRKHGAAVLEKMGYAEGTTPEEALEGWRLANSSMRAVEDDGQHMTPEQLREAVRRVATQQGLTDNEIDRIMGDLTEENEGRDADPELLDKHLEEQAKIFRQAKADLSRIGIDDPGREGTEEQWRVYNEQLGRRVEAYKSGQPGGEQPAPSVRRSAETGVPRGVAKPVNPPAPAADTGGRTGKPAGAPALRSEAPSGVVEGTPQTAADLPTSFGHAVPGEYGQSTPATALAKKVSQAERFRESRAQLESTKATLPELYQKARQRMDADPQAGSKLVDQLEADPRPASPVEGIMLLHEKVARFNEADRASEAKDQAVRDGRPQNEIDSLTKAADDAMAKVEQIEKVAQDVGSQWGWSGKIWQLLMGGDFTLRGFLNQIKKITGKDVEEGSDLHNEIKAIVDEINKAKEAENQSGDALDEANQKVKDVQRLKDLAESHWQEGRADEAEHWENKAKELQDELLKGWDRLNRYQEYVDDLRQQLQEARSREAESQEWKNRAEELENELRMAQDALEEADERAGQGPGLGEGLGEGKGPGEGESNIYGQEGVDALNRYVEQLRQRHLDRILRSERARAAWLKKKGRVTDDMKTPMMRAADLFQKVIVNWLISHLTVLPKLLMSGAQRLISQPLEEIGGLLDAKMFPGIAEGAPRHGGTLGDVMGGIGKQYKGFVQGFGEAYKKATGQKTVVEDTSLAGKQMGLLDWQFRAHDVAKEPAVFAEYQQSSYRIRQNLQRQGVDVNTPDAVQQIHNLAKEEALRVKFRQYSETITKLNKLLEVRPDTPWKYSILKRLGQAALPIRRMPFNFFKEMGNILFGYPVGVTRALVNKLYYGLDSLSPAQKDSIMRNMKKGKWGLAFGLMGLWKPELFGGFYQKDRPDQELKPMETGPAGMIPQKVLGIPTKWAGVSESGAIPGWALHNPMWQATQFGATLKQWWDIDRKKVDEDKLTTMGMIEDSIGRAVFGYLDEMPLVRETGVLGGITSDAHERAFQIGRLLRNILVPGAIQDIAEKIDTDPKTGKKIPRTAKDSFQRLLEVIPGLRRFLPVNEKKMKRLQSGASR